jgi:cephalosporin-C deacetylase-like acetyl esterase
MGLSFGGYLAPRAAAFEKRLKVCIADPGNLSWGDSIISALQTISHLQPHELPSEMNNLVRDYAWKHGVSDSVKEVIQALQAYDNTSVADKIECETLVMDGTEEIAKGQAQKLFDALKCPKHYMLFDETTTAQSHCQMGAYSTASEYLFDWLDKRL